VSTTVAVAGSDLVVRFTGWDRLWAISRGRRVALANVTSVRVAGRSSLGRPGLRMWGSYWPGAVTGGRYWRWRGRWQFWLVYRAERVLVVECAPPERYSRIVLQVDDPDAVAASLTA
jgi:hypothetical protein